MNYGVGFYFREKTPEGFKAIWYAPQLKSNEIGTGIIKGDTSNGFSGEYVVTYYKPNGEEAGTFDLNIKKTGSKYDLQWFKNGVQKYIGIGIDTLEGMAISYKSVE